MTENKFKRERENSSFEEELKTFAKSKKVLRSPRRTEEKTARREKEENEEMEEMKKMMIEMMQQVKQNIEENKELREEMRKEREKWEKEKKMLADKIEGLEERIENMEREKRKNNIIIKGKLDDKLRDEDEVKKFLQRKLDIQVGVKNVVPIGKKREGTPSGYIFLVELESWKCKNQVMTKKSALKGSDIYIENDLTREERRIQAELIKIAKEEKGKGLGVKIGYKKLIIDGALYKWSSKENGVVRQDASPKNRV